MGYIVDLIPSCPVLEGNQIKTNKSKKQAQILQKFYESQKYEHWKLNYDNLFKPHLIIECGKISGFVDELITILYKLKQVGICFGEHKIIIYQGEESVDFGNIEINCDEEKYTLTIRKWNKKIEIYDLNEEQTDEPKKKTSKKEPKKVISKKEKEPKKVISKKKKRSKRS